MFSSRTVLVSLATAIALAACGGSDSDTGENDSAITDSGSPMQKYVGKWKQKQLCIGPAREFKDTFVNGKYAALIIDNTVDSKGNLNSLHYILWFNNPVCTGIGERSPVASSTKEKLSCSTHLGVETIAGKVFDKVGRCDLTNAVSWQRITNGELELTDEPARANPTLVFVKYL